MVAWALFQWAVLFVVINLFTGGGFFKVVGVGLYFAAAWPSRLGWGLVKWFMQRTAFVRERRFHMVSRRKVDRLFAEAEHQMASVANGDQQRSWFP